MSSFVGTPGPVSQKILRQIVDVTKCYKIGDTVTICRKDVCENGTNLKDPILQRILRQSVYVTQCLMIGDTITICRKILCKTGLL